MTGWLLDTLVYTGLLIALVLLLRRPFGRWFGPQLAYGLWALPFLRLLLPPIVLPASLAPEPTSALVPSAEPAAELVTAAVEIQFEPIAVPVAAPPPVWEWADLIPLAASLWAGVALAFLAWRAVTYRRMRRELLADARPVGEIGKVRLVETPALTAPVAFGVLDKVIALPPLFMVQRDIAARDLAIEHELAHHKGHDLLANFAAQALLALHWFNPIAWYGWRAMRRDQEAACDARVLAGRGREDRLRYASLIAGIATGPRSIAFSGALAAPMACPVLGERSIVHRLRSLSMSEMSRRRRWFGRALVGASALALPLTASISYAAAQATPVAPVPPADAAPSVAPIAPEAPEAPEVPVAATSGDRQSVLRPEGGQSAQTRQSAQTGQGSRQGRQFAQNRQGAAPLPAPAPLPGPAPMPPMPNVEFQGWTDPTDPEFEARMETFEREMEQWSREMDDWGEKWGEQYAAQALAWADSARQVPEVIESCDEGERSRTTTADGRPRIVICEREIRARASIAHNSQIGDEVQREILADLDDEIERIERGEN